MPDDKLRIVNLTCNPEQPRIIVTHITRGLQVAVDSGTPNHMPDAPAAPPVHSKWIKKAGSILTKSEVGILNVIREQWPEGMPGHEGADDRDNKIAKEMKIKKYKRGFSKTNIKRLLQKIYFSGPK